LHLGHNGRRPIRIAANDSRFAAVASLNWFVGIEQREVRLLAT
jgi:hypothetical protein